MACRYAALFVVIFALGSELDLRAIALTLQDEASGQAAFAAAILHCGRKNRGSPRHHHEPASPIQEAATLVTALSLAAPLIVEPLLPARPVAFQATVLIGQICARAPPPSTLRAHRSRAPPLCV